MLCDRFNLLELVDLALRVPEVGAVNFNILHTVLTNLIIELQLDHLRPLCFIQDEVAAHAAITKGKLEDPVIKRRKSLKPTGDVKDIKVMLQPSDLKKVGMEEMLAPLVEDITMRVIEEKKSMEEKDNELPTSHDNESKDPDPKPEAKELEEEPGSKPEEEDPDSKPKQTDLTISLPDLTKDKSLTEVTDKEKAAEVRAVAAEILEKTSDAPAAAKELLEGPTEEEAGKVATQALRALTNEDIFQADPAKVVQEMWRSININRRMDGAEEALRMYSDIVDAIIERLGYVERIISENQSKFDELESYFERIQKLESRCEFLHTEIKEANEFTRNEIERLEEVIEGLTKELELSQEALKELGASYQSLSERVAYKEDLEELKNTINEDMNDRVKKLKRRIRELQDATVRKEDFAELVQRVDTLETDKVSREELGRLLEPGFIDNFLQEQQNLRTELDDLKLTVASVDENLNSLITRIEEEILKDIHQTFEEIRATIAEMKEKLDTLDADDINDTFARLEEQAEMIIKELEEIRAAQEKFEKEAKANFKKISDVSTLLNRLEATKADKSKMYELLELKADLEMVMGKLDRSEFVSVMQDMEEKIERLTITVKINEEEMIETFGTLKKELSFKMYTEDFIIGTEPIRNRIKAMIYEQKKIKDIALQNFFPDAPGVVKCFSCKRAANLISAKYPGPTDSPKAVEVKKESKDEKESTKSAKDPKEVKFPPIDVDEVPIPPPDKPRIQDIHQLPVLFANVRPQVGLAHEKRKRDIDKEIAEYFSTGRLYAVGGEHTKTFPQQRGLTYTTMKIPQEKRTEVLLKGLDRRYYKGAVSETPSEQLDHQQQSVKKVDSKKKVIPSAVVLQNAPTRSKQDATLSVPKTKSKQILNQSKNSGSAPNETIEVFSEQGAKASHDDTGK
ncbi:hypothetical protein AVEN_34620-1 [Araneus ventricosus]|uniref:DUF4795 domain-containing protein n=1 Tax=Araneus ventricosus TaxID=182803 RepID=A0A4Y2B0S3_ARAVE|nr:hypothetical protein AVEN_34620-1 [Araneus ventricosus]